MNRDGNYLAANQVTWERKTGQVYARGNVVLLTPQGDKLVGDNVQLTDTMRDGTIDNLMVVLASGGRIAAGRGRAHNGVLSLDDAIYSPCPVTTDTGCPKRPSWSITAARVIDDPASKRVRFEGGRLQLFGINLPLLPIFNLSRGIGGDRLAGSRHRVSSRNGFELAVPYHWQIGPNRDATITPHLYTNVLPAVDAQVSRAQQPRRVPARRLPDLRQGRPHRSDFHRGRERRFRGYFDGNGRFQLDPPGALPASFRVASDKTVTRRYDLTNDDRLRNVINAERITPDSYISIAGWAFQGLRVDDRQKEFRSPCRRSTHASGSATSPAASSKSRRTASRSCGSRARTRSAPSPACDGTCGG